VDLQLFRPGVTPPAGGPPVLVHVASLVPVKDQATLLEAAAGLRRRGVAFRLEIVGEGALEPALRAHATRLGIAPLVRFRGAVPHDALPAIYRSGTLFVLSSRHEAQGMAALEAAACGRPVVGAGVGVIPELAPQAAVAVPCRDPEALADALAAVLNDRERRCALGRAARARVEAEFDLHRSVESFRQVYASLAGRGLRASPQ
jgi:glycosyltransferase involved in cell wall biosynthesis